MTASIHTQIVRTWTDLPYQGKMETEIFETEKGAISVTVTSDDYYGVPATIDDLSFCQERLYGNPDVMMKYVNAVRTLENTAKRLERYAKRWQQTQDPFSGLVFRRISDDTPVAVSVLGHGDAYVDKDGNEHFTIDSTGSTDGAAGVADYAIVVDSKYHRQGIGKQITMATFFAYAPKLIEKGYFANKNEPHITPAPLSVIHMTARTDNVSHLALQGWMHRGIGSKFCKEGRNDFYINMSDIKNSPYAKIVKSS